MIFKTLSGLKNKTDLPFSKLSETITALNVDVFYDLKYIVVKIAFLKVYGVQDSHVKNDP